MDQSFWKFPKKQDMQLPYYSAIAFLTIYPRKMGSTYLHKNLYINVHSSLILNSKKPRSPIGGERLNKLIQPYHGMLLGNKK